MTEVYEGAKTSRVEEVEKKLEVLEAHASDNSRQIRLVALEVELSHKDMAEIFCLLKGRETTMSSRERNSTYKSTADANVVDMSTLPRTGPPVGALTLPDAVGEDDLDVAARETESATVLPTGRTAVLGKRSTTAMEDGGPPLSVLLAAGVMDKDSGSALPPCEHRMN
jgi:hypothetical protein